MKQKDIIKYEDFDKLDIKVGEIISAEKLEKSNKLIKLIIDFGEFQRQIIAGIATKYTAEELIGKKIPVIVNMAPRKMMGLESNGMILAVGDSKVEALLHPDNDVDNGSVVN
jgi:methionyl-tRNA synthetase